MQNTTDRIFFENIGGSFQFHARNAGDLKKILQLDPTAWAALCVPVASLNGDPEFFKALNGDTNGLIQADEVKKAIAWLLDLLRDTAAVDNASDTLAIGALNADHAEGAALNDFIAAHKAELDNGSGNLELASIRAKIAAVSGGALAGDGVLRPAAVAGNAGEALYTEITTLLATPGQLTLPVLEKFLVDAKSFVEWSKNTTKPLFREDEPEKYYAAFTALANKFDEYFRFCELICTDPAHAARFVLDPAKLPELDLADGEAIDALLKSAPLTAPAASGVLDLNAVTNPVYQAQAKNFAGLFRIEKLTHTDWNAIKAEMAPYINYLSRAQGDLAGKAGVEKLEAYLADTQADALRQLFARDKEVAGVLNNLHKLEKLLLFCRHLLCFVNNFVSFADFFDRNRQSMLQAGRLVMDGKSYNLAVWIEDVAAHKKIAVRSNLCLLYLELAACGNPANKRKVAVAVTGGSLDRIYVGKPAFFIDNNNVSYSGKVVDMVDGPISFSQTLFAPFRRLSAAISSKIQKLTDFSASEKQLAQSIDKGKLTPAAPAPAQTSLVQKLGGNGVMMLLAGGLSLAAIGAGLSYVFKSIVGCVVAISVMPWYLILEWIAVIALVILVPMAIFAGIRLRKRNLTMFLEAGGWAVNLPMRLNIYVSRLFTSNTIYPKNSRFAVVKKPVRKFFKLLRLALITAGVLLAAVVLALYVCDKFDCGIML